MPKKFSLYSFGASQSDDDDDSSHSWLDSGYALHTNYGGHGAFGDLIFLDHDSFARGGPGGGGGGGGGGGSSIPDYISGPAGGYNIDVAFKGTWTASQIADAQQAADYITQNIDHDIQ